MTNTQVYIRDKDHGWVPATVMTSNETTCKLKVRYPLDENDESEEGKKLPVERDVNLQDYDKGNLPLQNIDENGNLIEVDDMCDLSYLHEAAILYNLKARHLLRKPYTRVGDIIIAVNPFQWIDDLYSEENQELYAEKFVWNVETIGISEHERPHVYETSSLAYRNLALHGQNQAILVSGESGAGKTETIKIVMSHLAFIQRMDSTGYNSNPDGTSSSSELSIVVKRVLDSNPLLEAFGNAKTVRNDNSSRFGKYIQLQFAVEDATTAAYAGKSIPTCLIAGSFCETYLLEKTRVVGHELSERTFHIFYELLSAPTQDKRAIWTELENCTSSSSFKYVGGNEKLVIEGKTDAQKWEKTVKALNIVGIHGDTFTHLMRAICTVMQLGNLTFANDPNNEDNSVISSSEELRKLSDLMGIPNSVIENALTKRTVVAGKDVYSVPMNTVDANDVRDSFAKEIYHKLFDWLVRSINEATNAETNYEGSKDVEEYGLVGLLDIFGFESFKVNRFEQLCINYANEKLQQKYTIDVFRSVKEEYEFEGIDIEDVVFSDNAEVLRLVEGRMGIISVLNEECVRPKGDDVSFVSKMKAMNKDLECLVQNRLHRPEEFAIEHFAGQVKYDATNFVKKNMDRLPQDLIDCAAKSTNKLISTEVKGTGTTANANANANVKPGARSGRKKATLTVSSTFRSQLTQLITNISKTQTRYIRCIKPNPEKKPYVMNMLSSLEQLRCAGVIAAVKISRVAFPNRLSQAAVIDRFRCIGTSTNNYFGEEKKQDDGNESSSSSSSLCKDGAAEILLNELLVSKEIITNNGSVSVIKPFVVGKTKIYFRAGALEYLESQRLCFVGKQAIKIQTRVRAFVALSQFMVLKKYTIAIQAKRRRAVERTNFLRLKAAANVLQCIIRCHIAKKQLLLLKKVLLSIKLQSLHRMVVHRKRFQTMKLSITMIQKIARGSLQRPKFQDMKKEAFEELRVNNKLAALQKKLADAEMKWIKADKARIEAEKKIAILPVVTVGEGHAQTDGENIGKSQNENPSSVAVQTSMDDDDNIIDEQKALIDESGKMLEYLRCEVFKLRGKNYLLRTDLTESNKQNKRLTDQVASFDASYEAMRQHSYRLSKINMDLKAESNSQKQTITVLKGKVQKAGYFARTEVSKLKDEIKRKDDEIARLRKYAGQQQQQQLSETIPIGAGKGKFRRNSLKGNHTMVPRTEPHESYYANKRLPSYRLALGEDDLGNEYYSENAGTTIDFKDKENRTQRFRRKQKYGAPITMSQRNSQSPPPPHHNPKTPTKLSSISKRHSLKKTSLSKNLPPTTYTEQSDFTPNNISSTNNRPLPQSVKSTPTTSLQSMTTMTPPTTTTMKETSNSDATKSSLRLAQTSSNLTLMGQNYQTYHNQQLNVAPAPANSSLLSSASASTPHKKTSSKSSLSMALQKGRSRQTNT